MQTRLSFGLGVVAAFALSVGVVMLDGPAFALVLVLGLLLLSGAFTSLMSAALEWAQAPGSDELPESTRRRYAERPPTA